MKNYRIALLICLLASSVSSPASAQVPLIREGDVWNFFRGTVEPPAGWLESDFDADAAGWESGRSSIGYGDDDDGTILGDMQGNYVSVYLTKSFNTPPGLEQFIWAIRIRYDDAFVAYLDGKEVARRGISGEPPFFDQTAEQDHEIGSPTGFDELIFVDALSPGAHSLAVQVHNITIDSSDLSLSAELVVSPLLVSGVSPAFGPIEGGGTASIIGVGFDSKDAPVVRFGSNASESVEVISSQELEVTVPAAVESGFVDVEVEDSRGGFILSDGYRYAGGSGETALTFDGNTFATADYYGDLFEEGTFEFWFRRITDDFFDSRRSVMAIESPLGGDAFRIEVRSNQVRVRALVNGEFSDVAANVDLGESEWHHLAFAYSTLGRAIYLDGQPVGGDGLAMELPEDTRLRLGSRYEPGRFIPGGVVGDVESVRVWNYRRDEEDIRDFRFARIDSEAGLDSSWPLEEGVGQVSINTAAADDLILGEMASVEESDATWVPIEDFPSEGVGGIAPNSGPQSGGGDVTLRGSGFESGASVLFGDRPSPDVRFVNPAELIAEVPPADAFGPVDVRVISGDLDTVLPGGYTYLPDNLETVVTEGDLWDYYVATGPTDPFWATSEFEPEDAGWLNGPSGLGYGDEDDATDLPGMQNTAVTLYARILFDIPVDASAVDFLQLSLRYDDGFVAYLNGREIARRFVSGAPPAFDETASDLHEITGGVGVFDESIEISDARDTLQERENILAIEVHNFSLESSDLSMSAELVYASGGASGPRFVRGDVNGSGRLSVTDAVNILGMLFQGETISCIESADVANDGTVNLTDAVFLLNYLFLGGERPDAPFPLAGPDLDADDLDCADAGTDEA